MSTPRRRTDPDRGAAALLAWWDSLGSATEVEPAVLALAVRFSLEEFASRHPGRAVEIRVPPYGVVHALTGTVHTRGTPTHTVECDARTWLQLVSGQTSFAQAGEVGALLAAGTRSDLGEFLPIWADYNELKGLV